MLFYVYQIVLFIVYSVFLGLIKLKSNSVYGWIVTIHLTLLMGLRSQLVGTDTFQYVSYYEKQIDQNVPVYDTLSRVIYFFFGNNYRPFLLVVSFLTVAIIVWVLVQMEKDFRALFLSIYVYITFYFYFDSYNTQRQLMAASFVVLSLFWLFEKKNTLSIITMFCAIGIHSTALVMLIIFPIYLIKVTRTRLIILAFLSLVGVYFLSNLSSFFSEFFSHYSMYTDSLNADAFSATGGTSLIGIFLVIILIAVIWANPDFSDKSRKSVVTLVLIGAVLCIVGAHSQLVVRIGEYFTIFLILLLPKAIVEVSRKFVERFGVYCLLYGVVLLAGMTVFLFKLSQNFGQIVPYIMS